MSGAKRSRDDVWGTGEEGWEAGPVEGMLGSFSFLKPVTCSAPSEWLPQGPAKDEESVWN